MDSKTILEKKILKSEIADDTIPDEFAVEEDYNNGSAVEAFDLDENENEAVVSTLTIILYVDDAEELPVFYENLDIAAGEVRENIDVIEVTDPDHNYNKAYRKGFAEAKGDYVCFTRSDVRYSRNSLRKLLHLNKEEPYIYFMRPTYLDPKNKTHYYLPKISEGLVDFEATAPFFNLCVYTYFFSRDVITDDFFTSGLNEEAQLYGMIKLLNKAKKAYYIPNCRAFTNTASFNDAYNYSEQYYKNWYTQQLREELLPLIDECGYSRFIQFVMAYLVSIRFLCNWNDRNKSVINKAEREEFFEAVYEILQHIGDDIIIEKLNFGYEVLPKYMRYRLLEYKYREQNLSAHSMFTNTNMMTGFNDRIVGYKTDIKFFVYAINYENDNLIFDGRLTSTYCLDLDKLFAYLQIKDVQLYGERNYIYSLNKFFGQPVEQAYTFQVTVPRELFEEGAVISAYYSYDGHAFKIPMTFGKVSARISSKFGTSYWCFGDWIMRYRKNSKKQFLVINPYSNRLRRKFEHYLIKDYYKEYRQKKNKRALKSILLRKLYFLTRPLYKNKHLWLMFDQLFKGGDNGEYLFRYAMDHGTPKDIVPYYIINKNAVEYPGLKKKYGKHIIVFNSVRCKLLTLHASVIFATRVDIFLYCGFAGQLEKYMRGLLNAHVICLQHGLTIQRIAQYQNRLFDNTRKYFLVSPLEKENISHPAYGYDEDMMVMTGAPRYDGLVSRDKKQILITPTWRRNVTAGTNSKGNRNEYSVNFKHTEYFKIYNNLINDERVIKAAQETGYKLIYLIHPILSPQIGDYTVNDSVEIIPGSEINYETILSESSLMLTDYSGIQFDFAYMHKPVLYYHPDTLPPQYDSNVYNYATKALGPVLKNHEQVVEALCRYMRNNCQMEKEYEDRVNSFYAFSDRENSRRAYEEGIKYTREHFN